MSRWRKGLSGAFVIGLEHGAYCVGCCWAIMLLLFAGGVMNLTVIAALTAFVAFEKLAPFGVHGARIGGVLLIMVGFWMIVRSTGYNRPVTLNSCKSQHRRRYGRSS